MNVQEAGEFELVELPADPQSEVMKRQVRLQTRYGLWQTNLRDFGSDTNCLPIRVLHNLDMAIQECSEAWDMLEGGWKHHKKAPRETDPAELLMELIDVWHFLANSYLFMGGQTEAEVVAVAVARSREQLRLPRMGLQEVWDLGQRSWVNRSQRIERFYGHGKGAHGKPWEKSVATRVNFLRHRCGMVATAIRTGLEGMKRKEAKHGFPAASGYVYIETMPWLMVAIQGLSEPMGMEMTPQVAFSAFCHKNGINNTREDEGY